MAAQSERTELFGKLVAAIKALLQGDVAEYAIFLEQEVEGEFSWQMAVVREVLAQYGINRGQYYDWGLAHADNNHRLLLSEFLSPTVDLYDHFLPGKPLPTAA